MPACSVVQCSVHHKYQICKLVIFPLLFLVDLFADYTSVSLLYADFAVITITHKLFAPNPGVIAMLACGGHFCQNYFFARNIYRDSPE